MDFSFNELRNKLNIAKGQLYEDNSFEVDYSSYSWLRPKEMDLYSDDGNKMKPVFLGSGASRRDVIQGILGDCWVIVAAVAITQDKDLFQKVVPPDQDFESDKYCGAFYFQFCKDQQWTTVIVDDRLPTKNKKPVFARSSKNNEFWGALLEKAYIKFKKTSYKAIENGSIKKALKNFTGGMLKEYDLTNENDHVIDIYSLLTKPGNEKPLMIASIIGSSPVSTKWQGLYTNHAYNIVGIRKIQDEKAEKILIKIRDPRGQGFEWDGDFTDGSERLKKLEKEIEFQRRNGEFWMELNYFRKIFHVLQLCHCRLA